MAAAAPISPRWAGARWGLARWGGGTTAAAAARDLKQAIVAELRATPDFVALVGLNLFPDVIPQTATLPAVGYAFVASDHVMHLRGASGMQTVRVRFEIQGETVAQTEATKEVLRNRFQGLIGPLAGLRVCFVNFDTEVDGYYPPIPGSDLGTHFKTMDVTFKLRESKPTHT